MKVSDLLPGRSFRNRLYLRQPLFERAADHFLAIHEQADRLGDEIVFFRTSSM